VFEFQRATAHPGIGGGRLNRRVIVDELGWFRGDAATNGHEARPDRRLSAGARFEESAIYEQPINARFDGCLPTIAFPAGEGG
jgi:hypothetical protein